MRAGSGGARGQSRADGAADLTRGGCQYACARIGLASRLPAMPDEGRREGSLVKSAAAWRTSSGFCGPDFAFRASDRRYVGGGAILTL